MKIGVYGGSFNPIHIMHKEIVTSLLNKGYVDKIVLLPTGNYYKKSNLLDGKYRMKMLELAFKDDKRVEINDYEFKNNLISTYRSLDYLQSVYKDDDLYFIMGADNLKGFDTWKKYDYILDTYNLIIIDRDIDYKEELKRYDGYKGEIVIASNVVTNSVSSSEIRDYYYNNVEFDYSKYLDKSVYDYINEKGFYKKGYKEDVTDSVDEKEFYSSYKSSDYEKMSITTDIVLFSVSDIKKEAYRELDKKVFSVLLVKRNTHPFINRYCLPGGFVSLDEELEDCAKRVLFSETNLDNIYLEQLYTFSSVDRDPRTRVLSSAYLGLVDKNKLEQELKTNASFFNIDVKQENDIITIRFYNDNDSFECVVKETVNKWGIVKYEDISNEYLAFDHLNAIITSITRLKNKIEYTDLVFHMMPKYFTLKELQLVYEAILDKKLIDPVFRREIEGKVTKTNRTRKTGGHRPSVLYKYNG